MKMLNIAQNNNKKSTIFDSSKNGIIIAYLFAVVALCAIIVPIITSCTNGQIASRLAEKNIPTKEVKDINNRSVVVPENISTVATVGSAARICVYAGAVDKLVAVTEMEKPDVRRPYTIAWADKFSTLPTTCNGNHINSTDVDIEKLIDINPDVVISTRSAQECETLQQKSGIPVVGIYSQDEIFGGQLEQSINIVGEVCDCSDIASSTINKLIEFQKELNLISQGDSKFYRGAINFKGTKGMTGTVSKFCVYDAIKATNVADNDKITGGYDTSIEQIIAWNPDIAVFDCTNLDKVKSEYSEYSNLLKTAKAFANGDTYVVAPFNNNGTNVEYGICEAYYSAALRNTHNTDNTIANITPTDVDQKFEKVISAMLHVDAWQTLKEKGIKFEKVLL